MKIFPIRRVVMVVLVLTAVSVLRSQNNATQTQRFPQFENEDVKVWKSVVMPNSPLTCIAMSIPGSLLRSAAER